MVMVTGNSIYWIKNYVIKNYGKEFYQKLVSETEEESRKVLNGAILSSQKYDVKVKDELLRVFRENVESKEEFMLASVHEVEEQIKGLLRFVMKVLSFKFLAENMQLLWNKHFSSGTVQALEIGKRSVIFRISGVKGSDAFWLHVETYMKTLFEIATQTKFSSERRLAGLSVELIFKEQEA